MSTNYAAILGWCLDALFLHGIPYHYLVPEPLAVPNESIRTFYLDDSWLDVFLDGALRIGNYFSRETDVTRASIKAAVNTYLETNMFNGHLLQIPRWGFILRSEIMAKFPDLIISAPWPDPKDQRLEVQEWSGPKLISLFASLIEFRKKGASQMVLL